MNERQHEIEQESKVVSNRERVLRKQRKKTQTPQRTRQKAKEWKKKR